MSDRRIDPDGHPKIVNAGLLKVLLDYTQPFLHLILFIIFICVYFTFYGLLPKKKITT